MLVLLTVALYLGQGKQPSSLYGMIDADYIGMVPAGQLTRCRMFS